MGTSVPWEAGRCCRKISREWRCSKLAPEQVSEQHHGDLSFRKDVIFEQPLMNQTDSHQTDIYQ